MARPQVAFIPRNLNALKYQKPSEDEAFTSYVPEGRLWESKYRANNPEDADGDGVLDL